MFPLSLHDRTGVPCPRRAHVSIVCVFYADKKLNIGVLSHYKKLMLSSLPWAYRPGPANTTTAGAQACADPQVLRNRYRVFAYRWRLLRFGFCTRWSLRTPRRQNFDLAPAKLLCGESSFQALHVQRIKNSASGPKSCTL